MNLEKESFKISFSEYSTYIQCQHKWYLQYFLKIPQEQNEEFLFGSVVHETIETILTVPLIQKMFKKDPEGTLNSTARNVYKKLVKKIDEKNVDFLKKLKDGNFEIMFPGMAKNMILKIDFFNFFKEYSVYSVEYKLENILIYENEKFKILFKGYIDLILKKLIEENSYLILDWKTSSKPWDIDKKLEENPNLYMQLLLYKFFFSETKNIPLSNINIAFFNLPKGKESEVKFYEKSYSDDFVRNFANDFIQTCVKICEHRKELKNFIKVKHVTPKNFCGRCQFNKEEFCNDYEEFQIIK